MANNYGRGGAASTGAAQKASVGSAYEFTPRNAMSYLTGEEQVAYGRTMASSGKGMYGQAKKEQLRRLRDLAASRALTDFESQNMQYSKPWLHKASAGLITAEDSSKGEGLGVLGLDTGKEIRDKLRAIALGEPVTPDFYVDPLAKFYMKKKGAMPGFKMSSGGPRKYFTPEITNVDTAYSGIGGLNWTQVGRNGREGSNNLGVPTSTRILNSWNTNSWR